MTTNLNSNKMSTNTAEYEEEKRRYEGKLKSHFEDMKFLMHGQSNDMRQELGMVDYSVLPPMLSPIKGTWYVKDELIRKLIEQLEFARGIELKDWIYANFDLKKDEIQELLRIKNKKS